MKWRRKTACSVPKYLSSFLFTNVPTRNSSNDLIATFWWKMNFSPPIHLLPRWKIMTWKTNKPNPHTKSKNIQNSTYTQKIIGTRRSSNSRFYNNKTNSWKTKSKNFSPDWGKRSSKSTGSSTIQSKSSWQSSNWTGSSWLKFHCSPKKYKASWKSRRASNYPLNGKV